MSLPLPLAVTLSTANRTMSVTRQARDLQFRSTVPGGFASAVLPLDRPLALDPTEIGYYGRLIVTDTRHGGVIWEGRVEDPGRSARADGEIWEVAAVGPAAHASDRTVPLIYVDTALTSWTRDNVNTARSARIDISDTIDMSIPRGVSDVISTYQMRAHYGAIAAAGLTLGRVKVVWTAGNNDTNHRFKIRFFTSSTDVYDAGWSTGTTTATCSRGGANDIPSGDDSVEIMYQRITSTVTIADDTTFQSVSQAVVQARRFDVSGAVINSGYTTDTVTVEQVVADLLGRLLTQYDGPNASIDSSSAGSVDQLAYPDGVSARRVLDDLIQFNPNYYWAAWERQAASGKYRFEWRGWPGLARYDADTVDGYESAGSADGLYDKVRVRYRDPSGQVRTVQRTSEVQVLTDAGLTREAYLDLGDEVGSQANAEQAGDRFLAEHGSALNAGRLTVARPIRDTDSGRMVSPWEIRPGHLIRVSGILPRVDALNAAARDGVTIFRVTAVEFSARTGMATLELDSPPPSTAHALAALQRRPDTRRR